MNTSSPLHQERLLRERAELLKRIAQERGGLVSRVDMAAEHDVRDFENRAQAISERDDEFAMNEHETAELGALDAADLGTASLVDLLETQREEFDAQQNVISGKAELLKDFG